MPFIRYNRDKRGFETTVVMHAYRSPQGGQRQRVLYLFRSPANLAVGRRAFDEEVVEALEHTHPDVPFDWPALLRGQAEARSDARVRADVRGPRREGPRGNGSGARRRPDEARPSSPIVVEDESPLGGTLGAAAAATLRQRYRAALQNVARRARTPEERDRLTDELRRLNPDEWGDEAAIRSGAARFDADLAAVTAGLPQRRRGRRGGRRREAQEPASAGVSAIMEAGEDHETNPPVDADRDGGGSVDDRPDRPDPDPEPGPDDVRRES